MTKRLALLCSCFVLLATLSLNQVSDLLATGLESPALFGQTAQGHKIVASIPVGADGVHYAPSGEEILAWGPTALAVAPDGDFWIADAVANRLLHYAANGKRLGVIDLSPHHVVGVGDLEATTTDLLVLDIAAVTPRVLRLALDGRLLASYDIPESLGVANGLSGIARGEQGEILVERNGGALLSQLVTTRGALAPMAVAGYSFGGRLYAASAGDLASADASVGVLAIGERRIEVRTTNALGGLSIVGVRAVDDVVYALVEEVALGADGVQVDQTVRRYSTKGDMLGAARLALAAQHLPVAHSVALGPDGALYNLVTKPDRVQIERLTFSLKLQAVLMPATPGKNAVPATAPAATCLSRADMLATARSYVNNSKYLNAANTDGPCTNRMKPHYLSGAGTYPSVSYDLGGFDTVSGWNSMMDPNTYQAGDAPDPGNIESCSRGVDCSGFVSRAWALPVKYWTGTIPNVSTALPSLNDLRPGDVFNDPKEHVMLFESYVANGIKVYESTSSQNFDRVVYNFRPWSFLSAYVPRRFNGVCADAAPAAPTSLRAAPAGSTQIALSWNASSGDRDGYRIYNSAGAAIATTTNASYTVNGLAPCTEYSFTVSAYKGSNESISSAPASARTNRPPHSGEISGRVLDVAGNPMIGALLTMSNGDDTASSDGDGRYVLCGTALGAARVSATLAGYQVASADVTASDAVVAAPDLLLSPACPIGQWRAEYFSGRNLSGAPARVACEPDIVHDWGAAGPGGGIASDGFSVRWLGYATFENANYTFIARADDGLRVWVDGVAIISDWTDHVALDYQTTRSMTAGVHQVVVEYYENTGQAVAQVRWERIGGASACPSGQYVAQYYANTALSGSPTLTRCEASIANLWGNGGPGNGVPNDGFSARWTGRHSFAAGVYTFIARSDDGTRLWLDGALLIDAWRDQAATEQRTVRAVTAGEHEVKVEYYENRGAAVAQMRWEQVLSGVGHLAVTNVRFSPVQVASGSLLEVRVDVTNDGSAPLALMGPDNATYSEDGSSANARASEAGKWRVGVEIEGRVGTGLDHPYRFGKDMILNPGQSVTVGGYIRLTTPRSMDAWVGAVQELVRWDQDNLGRTRIAVTTACPSGQFLAQYFNGRTLSGAPVFSRCETSIAGAWGNGGPGSGVGSDNFSVRWVGRASFSARAYTFVVRSDDGVRLWIDGQLVLDRWFDQSPTEYRLPRTMTAGEHVIQVEYYENAGGAQVGVRWE
jgi:hypothetical protein